MECATTCWPTSAPASQLLAAINQDIIIIIIVVIIIIIDIIIIMSLIMNTQVVLVKWWWWSATQISPSMSLSCVWSRRKDHDDDRDRDYDYHSDLQVLLTTKLTEMLGWGWLQVTRRHLLVARGCQRLPDDLKVCSTTLLGKLEYSRSSSVRKSVVDDWTIYI